MNIENTGTQTRATLRLPLGGKRLAGSRPAHRPSGELSRYELRRIVAAMVD
jgi:hypothetical protein